MGFLYFFFMKIFAIALFFIFSCNYSNAGILFPWNPIMNVYTGVDYQRVSVSDYKIQNRDITKDITSLKNTNLFIGVRAFKFLGLETGYNQIKKDIINKTLDSEYKDFKLSQKYLDVKFYLPVISLLAVSVDLYANYGLASIDSSLRNYQTGIKETSNVTTASRYGIGLETSLFGTVSARTGWTRLAKKIDILDNKYLDTTYFGLSVYLL